MPHSNTNKDQSTNQNTWFTHGNKDPSYQKGRDSTLLPSDSDLEDNKKMTEQKSSIHSYHPKPKSDSKTSSDETDIMARFKALSSSWAMSSILFATLHKVCDG